MTARPETQTVDLPEAGAKALDDASTEQDYSIYTDWLETDEGQEFLAELREALPRRVQVYRGLNGVLAPHPDDCVGDYDWATEAPTPDEPEGITGHTSVEDRAWQYATGRRADNVGDPAPYGTVLTTELDADQIVYHADYVEDACHAVGRNEVIAIR